MSTASKLTLVGTTIGTIGIVAFVHWAQTAEKSVSWEQSYYSTPCFPVADNIQGNACRCRPRHGAATSETRASSRLRDAAAARRTVQESTDCVRRYSWTASQMTFTTMSPSPRDFDTTCRWKEKCIPTSVDGIHVKILSRLSQSDQSMDSALLSKDIFYDLHKRFTCTVSPGTLFSIRSVPEHDATKVEKCAVYTFQHILEP